MKITMEDAIDIKRRKGDYWSRPGAGSAYEAGASSSVGFVQIKNRVERSIVLENAKGFILDAGTGTGRFAIPLAGIPGNSVVALDFSREMLDLNHKLSTQQGITSIDYVQGDVEHLPFPDNHFDAVVSITVVRHFPQWQNILIEYVRVLKPGGTLIFEMCSGDHLAAANQISLRFGSRFADDFFAYEAEVPFEELRSWLCSIGLEVKQRMTYDFLNNNCFLKIASINTFGYRVVNKALRIIFSLAPLQRMMAWLELNLLRRCPTSFSYNYMVIGHKR